MDAVVARYYDATIGRFISPDSIVPSWTNPQSLNRYIYCGNNPLAFTDPSGHNWLSDKISGAGKAIVDTVVDVGKTTCEFVAFSAQNMTTADYWGDVGDMFLGYGDAIEGALYGVMNTIHDPVGTAGGVVNAASDPGGTWDAVSANYGLCCTIQPNRAKECSILSSFFGIMLPDMFWAYLAQSEDSSLYSEGALRCSDYPTFCCSGLHRRYA